MDQLKIVSFNLRNTWKNDGINGFIHRVGMIYEQMEKAKPDVVAFQEVMPEQLTLLSRMFPEYTFFGQGRKANFDGEGLYTAVKTDLFLCPFYETFWISPTPTIPASRFADQSDCPRICVVTKLRRISDGVTFRVLNIHLDHISDAARIEGIHCIADYLAKTDTEAPAIVLGDFNAEPDTETIRFCAEHTPLFDLTGAIPCTYHGYGKDSQKIDYIFVSAPLRDAHIETMIWDACHEGIYLSDHYPVCAVFDAEKLK